MYTYNEAIEYIESIPKFTSKNDHIHTAQFLQQLGLRTEEDDISAKFKIIHVAGTNGKGSVCAFLSNVLVKCGKRTGLFISPHLIKHNERIRINNEIISDDGFVRAFEYVKHTVEQMENMGLAHPSYFEFLLGMGMYIFDKEEVEYIVLETGLGGRLDATNVFKKPYLTVITPIGLDHMEYLGDSVAQITTEKAGIIKPGVPVIYWGEDENVAGIIEMYAKMNDSLAIKVSKKDYKIIKKTHKGVDFYSLCGYYLKSAFTVPFIADYQVQNAMLALRTIEMLEDIREEFINIQKGIAGVKWEGRMEPVAPGIIFDGAHNGPGIDEFIHTFQEYACNGRKYILFSAVKDKDYDYMISRLCDTDVSRIYITRIDSSRGLEEHEIFRDFSKYHVRAELKVIHNVRDAFVQAVRDKEEQDVLFCVGSLYLIGELKRELNTAGLLN